MKILWFIKRLIALDVFWGRRSKIFHGIKDNGAIAASINDTSKAISSNGCTIFNVNNLENEPQGGHYHTVIDTSEICLLFEASDWVNNKIVIIPSGTPIAGQIGPHNQTNSCMSIQKYEKLNILGKNTFKEVDFEVFIEENTYNITMYKSSKTSPFAGKVKIDAK